MSVAEAAKAIGISRNALYNRITAGLVRAERIGERVWLIPADEVERLKGTGRLKTGPKGPRKKRES